LLSLRTFVMPGTFKPVSPSDESTSTLSLESLIISTLLGSMLSLPSPPFPQIYYTALIAELCKASPNTVAPPVGRAVRKIYGGMGGDGMDVEVMKRLGDWFSTHLSNFGFQWMWKEWYVCHRGVIFVAHKQDPRFGVTDSTPETRVHEKTGGSRGATGISRSHPTDTAGGHAG
jgi:hypothetical protein